MTVKSQQNISDFSQSDSPPDIRIYFANVAGFLCNLNHILCRVDQITDTYMHIKLKMFQSNESPNKSKFHFLLNFGMKK